MDERDLEKEELFNIWNQQKQKLDANKRRLLFKEGEIWWCSLGINVGEEVFGKGKNFTRPVVILKKLSSNTCVVLPLSTKIHLGEWYYTLEMNNSKRSVLLHQIRSISANRLYARQSGIPEEDFIKIKKSTAQLLGLS